MLIRKKQNKERNECQENHSDTNVLLCYLSPYCNTEGTSRKNDENRLVLIKTDFTEFPGPLPPWAGRMCPCVYL